MHPACECKPEKKTSISNVNWLVRETLLMYGDAAGKAQHARLCLGGGMNVRTHSLVRGLMRMTQSRSVQIAHVLATAEATLEDQLLSGG